MGGGREGGWRRKGGREKKEGMLGLIWFVVITCCLSV